MSPKMMSKLAYVMPLVESMTHRFPIEVEGVMGVVNAIEAEDGSGTCWNVTLCKSDGTGSVTVFHRVPNTHV